MNRRTALAAVASTSLITCSAWAKPPADGKDDIEVLRRALALHPGLYRYNKPAEIDRSIDALATTFVRAPTLKTRYLVLSRFLATIGCGHTYANFLNQRPLVSDSLFARSTRLPFHFCWIDRRMIVTADPEGLGIKLGSEVLTINGIPASTMLAALMPYARADGHNDAKRRSLLGVSGSDSIEYFDVFHGLIYGAPASGEHLIRLRTVEGVVTGRSLPAINLTAGPAQMVGRDYGGDQPVWDWTVRPDGIALLTMPSWALYDTKWDWRHWLNERLDSCRGTGGLIIDLRQNEGGEDCGDPLLARLIDRPIAEPHAERRIRFRRTPPDLDPYLTTWDNSFRSLGVDARPSGDGFFIQTGANRDASVSPVGRRLDLRVAALLGPANSSATFQFAVKARLSGRVRLFGETTGGNQRGINGGCFFFVRLPASGLEFDLPLIGYYPPGFPPDAGLEPDVRVAQSAADIAAGRDPAMSAAADWLLRS